MNIIAKRLMTILYIILEKPGDPHKRVLRIFEICRHCYSLSNLYGIIFAALILSNTGYHASFGVLSSVNPVAYIFVISYCLSKSLHPTSLAWTPNTKSRGNTHNKVIKKYSNPLYVLSLSAIPVTSPFSLSIPSQTLILLLI